MKRKALYLIFSAILVCWYHAAIGQVASGGGYTLDQTVNANGGGGSNGANFAVIGTGGQPLAGTQSNAGSFGVRGGFWQSFFAPTAALVSVSGQVMTANGSPVYRARVTLTNSSGTVRSFLTNNFGYYRFDDIESGETLIVTVAAKQMQFVPRVVFVNDELTNFDLIALP